MANSNTSKWPKLFPELSAEQARISDDFMHYWHEVLPNKYSVVDKFNHNYTVRTAPKNFSRTLEIGAGTGEHLKYEHLSSEQERDYFAVDIRQNMIDDLSRSFPSVNAFVGDCQQPMSFEAGYFDRILAIHVLEHLPNLPAAIKEMHRLCSTSRGVLQIVIPCEGSLAYTIARKISAQRIFENRYQQSYKWFIEREHINSSTYFPLPVPAQFCNLCIGANFIPKTLT
jgi:SAM-dependent methyltransferase